MKNVIILCSMYSEIEKLLNLIKPELKFIKKNIKLYFTIYKNINLYFGISGIGKKNVNKFFDFLDENKIKPDYVLSLGYAAAIKKNIKPGKIVIPYSILNDENDEFKLEDIFINNDAKIYKGLTVDKVYYKIDKLNLSYERNDIDFIDMESFYILKNCKKRDIKIEIIRSISDCLMDELPSFKIMKYFFSKKKFKLFKYLIKNFIEIPVYFKFKWNLKKANKSLNKMIIKILDEIK